LVKERITVAVSKTSTPARVKERVVETKACVPATPVIPTHAKASVRISQGRTVIIIDDCITSGSVVRIVILITVVGIII
jgi:adenine/guanine phosphoribosyltransferase-like PRPP-binding protein